MTRFRTLAVVIVGLSFVAAGLTLAVVTRTGQVTSPIVIFVMLFVVLGVFVGILWKVHGTLDTRSDAPVAWAPDEPFSNPAPERTTSDYSLSSEAFADTIRMAGERARGGPGTVEDGIKVIRPLLRETLSEALVQGGQSREEVQRALSEGTWTDDLVAASVLDADVSPSTHSLCERVRTWLSPERAVQQRVRRATQAVAETADEALPTVPGQNAPRTVPVVRPRLEDLQRGVDGSFQRAVDSRAVTRARPVLGPDESGIARTRGDASTDESETDNGSEPEPVIDGEEDGVDMDEEDGTETGRRDETRTGDGDPRSETDVTGVIDT